MTAFKPTHSFQVFGQTPLLAAVKSSAKQVRITMQLASSEPTLLHWGLGSGASREWHQTADSPFQPAAGGGQQLLLQLPRDSSHPLLFFVLHQPQANRWENNRGQNFTLPLSAPGDKPPHPSPPLAAPLAEVNPELLRRIVEAETGRNSWTLMHRYNLAAELLDGLDAQEEDWALLFVWLRYSAIRQLVWQKNYNTKPSELAHAQHRFTLKLASYYRGAAPGVRALIRLILSTLGRGGEGGKGQRIRDDILHIMHRHKIKEVSGHFIEEWHQKLHNNTTPDDIGICEAYLGFLHNHGDLALFYKILANSGISKERLASFERPIHSAPDFVPYLREGLIHDFENFLKLLKSVHSATDLQSAIQQAEPWLDGELRQRLWRLYSSAGDRTRPFPERVRELTALRETINRQLEGEQGEERIRDLLYLDLGLEDHLRTLAEGQMYEKVAAESLISLIAPLTVNVCLTHHDPELALGGRHWRRLEEEPRSGEWSLHGVAVLDRLSRALGSWVDGYHHLLQGKAEYLGQVFKAAPWTIELFNQEVVRARSGFVLAALIKMLEPQLRGQSGAGSWQLISQEEVTGKVMVAELATIQERTFTTPRILLSETINGGEELPRGVVAVLTPAGVDILSHVAIRARNARILFATCHDPKLWLEIKERAGSLIAVTVKANGELGLTAASAGELLPQVNMERLHAPRPGASLATGQYLLTTKEFQSGLVGGKSLNLARLLADKPKWLGIPESVAIPFGVCERVLSELLDEKEQQGYEELLAQLERGESAALPRMRALLLALPPSPPLLKALRAKIKGKDLTAPLQTGEDWHLLWAAIKQVWASKWNDRAYWSRRRWSISHRQLLMAVLIQPAIPAAYAFVIHTRNPLNGRADELYAEVMPGLGETICSGNYPGRAFSFRCPKAEPLQPVCLSYPSKSVALRGGGLIVRSDSNGEDLEGYAGAGLYDSVLLRPPQAELVDYTQEKLLWSAEFRQELMVAIARLGLAIEAMREGEAQDIEGTYADGQYTVVQTRPQV